jgi:Uma2 family endonuclease
MKKNSSRASLDEGEPAWEVARLFPAQGHWSEEDYLSLDGNYFVEYSQGHIEVLPMPTLSHQRLLAYLYGLLLAFVDGRDMGEVLFAPLKVRIQRREYREPDILFALKEHANLKGERFWKGADLVMEIVSPDAKSRRRDLKKKRRDYAQAGITEYWIIDPREETMTVLRLVGESYEVHGEFSRGEIATSHLLPGFTVDVTAAFDRQNPDSVKPANGKRRRKN